MNDPDIEKMIIRNLRENPASEEEIRRLDERFVNNLLESLNNSVLQEIVEDQYGLSVSKNVAKKYVNKYKATLNDESTIDGVEFNRRKRELIRWDAEEKAKNHKGYEENYR